MIKLPYGGSDAQFSEHLLVAHLKAHFRDYIIQGQQHSTLLKHTKPNSLDFWLRTNFAIESDTKQAVNEVIDQLVATGKFTIADDLPCPDSGRRCKGLKLISET